MVTYTHIDHVAINTHDMEATLQFYCGVLGMRLARTMRTPDGRRHYNIEIGGGNAFAVFDGAERSTKGEHQLNHLSLGVATPGAASPTSPVRWESPTPPIRPKRLRLPSTSGTCVGCWIRSTDRSIQPVSGLGPWASVDRPVCVRRRREALPVDSVG